MNASLNSFRATLVTMERAIRDNDGAAVWETMHGFIERKTRRELLRRFAFIAPADGCRYESPRTVERAEYVRDGWKTKKVLNEYTGTLEARRVPRFVPTGGTVVDALPDALAGTWADVQQEIGVMLLTLAPVRVAEKGSKARYVPIAERMDLWEAERKDPRLQAYYLFVNRAFAIAVHAYGMDTPRNLPITEGYNASDAGAERAYFAALRDEDAEAELVAAEKRADTLRMIEAGSAFLHGLPESERAFMVCVATGAPTDDKTSSARARFIKRVAAQGVTADVIESAMATVRLWAQAL